MSNFVFLKNEWPLIYDAAARAETFVHSDPRTACFHARRALELAVGWAFKFDSSLKMPYQENLSALVHEPSFKATAGDAVFSKSKVIITLGNQAVHSQKPIHAADSLVAVRELFHVAYWLAHTYARQAKPEASIAFNPQALPAGTPVPRQTLEQLQKLGAQLREKDEKLNALLADKASVDEELERLRQLVAAAKQANLAQPDTHDYYEAETRDYFIDLLLKEAGWPLDQTVDREFQVTGMPNTEGVGYVDYVLWGNDGKPLGIVEAKRTKRAPLTGQQQAKLYADCLEQMYGQRPVIYYSNGYEHWLWDDQFYPPRLVQGFHKKAELELMIQRRQTRRKLAEARINEQIVERHYQTRAVRKVAEAFERDHERKALLVMATGSGKTRTVIAASDLLMRANWAKRVLFLADRVALVNQAVNAFKRFLPDSSPVNLVTEKDAEGRVFVSTYPTMMGLIDDTREGQRRFGVGHFDLVIVDEAHRSIFHKYRAIFSHFDSLLVGLTATPKDELDRNTYSLFDLENGVPTDAYGLDEAVKDGYLVPPKAVSVPLKFQREGINYNELSEEEKEQWDALEWNEDGEVPEFVDSQALNKWLFNIDTVDKVLEHLMTRGQKVAGGDRLGKTIIFAKNQAHAEFIEERFNKNYPHFQGQFARIITFKTEYAQSLIDDFSQKEKAPHIAISVDMLDTGIDVPEVVNVVFFKMVRSKTKFWQMIGRGTRLCPDLFGPGQHKEFFYLFDYCQNLEFFNQNPNPSDGYVGESLGTRLFRSRLDLVTALDARLVSRGEQVELKAPPSRYEDPATEAEVRAWTADQLFREVTAMNLENVIVRQHRRAVEKYNVPQPWTSLTPEAMNELSEEVAGLPSELPSEDEEAKRFDMLALSLQLAVLNSEPAYERLRDRVRKIAGLLEEKSAIPMVNQQMELIQDVQSDAWWQDVTIPMLERLRRRLRDLVKFIEKQQRKPIYTDFRDEMGVEMLVDLPGVSTGTDYDKFRAKARVFLRQHQDHITIHKLRMNRPLTVSDLDELERMLNENGVGTKELIEKAKLESEGLGLFVRNLIGLDREAAKQAFAGFLSQKTWNSNQIEFVNMMIDYLTEHGAMSPELLYESPFTDITPQGPDGLFGSDQVDHLIDILTELKSMAKAA